MHGDSSKLSWQKHGKFSFIEPDLNKNPIGNCRPTGSKFKFVKLPFRIEILP